MSHSMRLLIQPLDVLLFRDGKPFKAGNDHHAGALFPPPPSVLQGAVRATHAAIRNVSMDDYVAGSAPELEAEIGKPGSDELPFALEGPHVALVSDGSVVRYFPRPADGVAVRGGLRPISPVRLSGVCSNMPDDLLLFYADNLPDVNKDCNPPDEDARWVREDALAAYLTRGEAIPSGALASEHCFLERENRYGISLDSGDKRQVEEGQLYEAEFLRMQPNAAFVAHVRGLEGWPSRGLIKLGGEHRLASFEAHGAKLAAPMPQEVQGLFKLYFATPACFDGGWKPKSNWSQFFDGPAPCLKAAALGRYESQGGYDLFRNTDKPAQRFVPAGSVYFFEATQKTILKPFNVTEYGAAMGYGQVMLGKWS